MEDYPRDLLKLERRFWTEVTCREYLFQLRWLEGFCCPRCGARKAWAASDLLWECAACHRQISVTTGTRAPGPKPEGLLLSMQRASKLLKILVGERGFEPPTPWSRIQ